MLGGLLSASWDGTPTDGFDTGEGLTEHTAVRPAIIQVLSGRLRFTVEGDEIGTFDLTLVCSETGDLHRFLEQVARPLAENSKKINYVTIKVIVDFKFRWFFAEKNTGGAAKGFDIALVRRELIDDPGR